MSIYFESPAFSAGSEFSAGSGEKNLPNPKATVKEVKALAKPSCSCWAAFGFNILEKCLGLI